MPYITLYPACLISHCTQHPLYHIVPSIPYTTLYPASLMSHCTQYPSCNITSRTGHHTHTPLTTAQTSTAEHDIPYTMPSNVMTQTTYTKLLSLHITHIPYHKNVRSEWNTNLAIIDLAWRGLPKEKIIKQNAVGERCPTSQKRIDQPLTPNYLWLVKPTERTKPI